MSDITDITWQMISAAGIDTDRVSRQHTSLGVDEYVMVRGDVKVAFGPAVDVEDGGTLGWDVSAYERVDGDWDQTHQDWAETPDGALQLAAYLDAVSVPGQSATEEA